jgi:hypothetical protein
MQIERQIPYYAPDGSSLGSRTYEAAQRLIDGGYVKPSWGRKGHLRAIWLQSPDGSNPIQTQARLSTKYSVIERLQHGRCWKLRCLDRRDEDGVLVNTRGVFQQVLKDCLVP